MLYALVEYRILFDVNQAGYRQWTFPAFGLIFVVLGSVMFLIRRRLRGGAVRNAIAAYFVPLFAIAWTLLSFVTTFRDYDDLRRSLRESRCAVVEGVVTNLRRLPPTGAQKAESFEVGKTRFQYSDYEVSAGFNHMQSRGGPMREGMMVRISHLNGEIARLEERREP